jgi:hypothetical protein
MATWIKKAVQVSELFVTESVALNKDGIYLGTGQLNRVLSQNSAGEFVTVKPLFGIEHYGKNVRDMKDVQPIAAYTSVLVDEVSPTV